VIFSGWATFYSMNVAPDSTFANYYHYAYVGSEDLQLILMNSFCFEKTQPPVIVSMIIVALWAAVAIEIQTMQPYIDLVHGHAPAKRSILLDYTRERCVDFQHLSLVLIFTLSLANSSCGYQLSLTVIIRLLLLHWRLSLHSSYSRFAHPYLSSRIRGGALIVSVLASS
jgi:Protein of unknown function (DUF3433)